MAAAYDIPGTLISAAKLANGSSDVMGKDRPEVDKVLFDKSRWLQGAIRNNTEFRIAPLTSTFHAGRYHDSPEQVSPFHLGTFTACNGDNTFMTGVSGGQAYRIPLTENMDMNFSIGFTNPWSGSYKAGVAWSSDPEAGYNAATSDGGNVMSDLYKAKDEDGKDFTFRIAISASAGQKPNFVVTEERFYK